MGSNACKPDYLDHQRQATVQQLPQLSQQIKSYLQIHKPFERQLQQQKNIIRKYPDGIYQGSVNFLDNPHQYGKLYKNDGSLYVGKFSNGKAEGQGILIFKDGSYAKGKYNNNIIQEGTYYSSGFKYIGKFKNNLFHGNGQQSNTNPVYQFQGKYQNGKKKSGVMTWTNNKTQYKYEGSFDEQENFLNKGKLAQKPFGYYIGEYKNNKKHGKGIYEYENGIKYQGQYVNGNKEGLGKLFNADGSISYEGYFKNGLPHGSGKAYNKQKKLVQTNWVQGIDKSFISK